ncbi:MAG: hypothetical protein OXN17_04490 [Candidatus Poribacteria bacterium]|nr:hypothetical protein [Candidatus Poribacteria bacterium]MDE0503223.1 hypothetical protein [Candidatus Poribacteria bacterium]
MERDYFDMIYSDLFPIVYGIMALFFFWTGIRAILTKRPFLVSNRWLLSVMFVVFVPMIVRFVQRPLDGVMGWTNPILFGTILLMMWYQLRGYVAHAVTDTSFREALVAALQKLQLPYGESLSVIRLTSVDADLQIAVQSWMGTGTIKVKQREHRAVLREIVTAMNDYFRSSRVSTNLVSSVFLVVAGAAMAILALDMSRMLDIY